MCKRGVTSRRHLGDQIRRRRAAAWGAGRDLRVCSLIGTWEEAEAPLRPEVGRQGYGLRITSFQRGKSRVLGKDNSWVVKQQEAGRKFAHISKGQRKHL